MDDKLEKVDEVVQHWLDSADLNAKTMSHMIDTKDYSWALFIGHLVIEKTLKALYVKRLGRHAIFTHDLLRLSSKIGLELSEEQEEWLDKITTFNLNARYDNYNQEFYRLCTREYTEVWIDRIIILRKWLVGQL